MGGEISEAELNDWLEDKRRDEIDAANERIRQLEHLNVTLAAEIDKLRQSSELAYTLFFILKDINTDSLTEYEQGFVERMRVVYEKAHEAAKEGGE